MQQAVANGFQVMITPALVRPEIMGGTGFLGAHASEVYKLADDDLYLVGTSEVPLAGFHADEILDLSTGPRRYAGWSSCFRREAGSSRPGRASNSEWPVTRNGGELGSLASADQHLRCQADVSATCVDDQLLRTAARR